jgi:phosphopentomutase
VFANLVDFDQAYGHRNDPDGYAGALIEFDAALPSIQASLGADDVLIITADHGNDPTTPSTDHSRERVPLLVWSPAFGGVDLGTRGSFSDCGKTIAELLGVATSVPGESFAGLLVAG